MSVKNNPKIVSIAINSPSKKASPKKYKQASPRYLSPTKQSTNRSSPQTKPIKDPYKSSIGQLQKTFGSKYNVLTHLASQNKRKKTVHEIEKQKERKNQQQLKQQLLIDQQVLSKEELGCCKYIFNVLDEENKNYTEIDDLSRVKEEDLTDILLVVYIRKERSTFFDFVYALWESGNTRRLLRHLTSKYSK